MMYVWRSRMLLEGQVKQTSDKGCQVYRLIFDLTTILTNHINRSFSTRLTCRCLFLNRHRQDCKWREHPITSHSYQRRLQKIRLKTKQTCLLKRNSEPTCPRFLGMNPASLTRRKDPLHELVTWLVTTWQRLHSKQSVWQKSFEVRSSVCFVGEWKRLTTVFSPVISDCIHSDKQVCASLWEGSVSRKSENFSGPKSQSSNYDPIVLKSWSFNMFLM